MDESNEATATQRKWQAIANELQIELRKLIPLIPAMKPDEAKALAETLESSMWLELNAGLFDKRTELELQKITSAD